MTESIKATRASVQIGAIEVDGFMLPDGSYRMSQAQVAQAVGKPPVNALRFLESKALKGLLGEGYTDYSPEQIEIEPELGRRGQSRFNALPLEVATAYWVNQCFQGNKQALALVMALTTETLERRFDNAFGVTRTEQERQERLEVSIQQLEQELGEAFAFADQANYEKQYMESVLRQHGIDPWALPNTEEHD
jgi:AraC-like DNA-binding protein